MYRRYRNHNCKGLSNNLLTALAKAVCFVFSGEYNICLYADNQHQPKPDRVVRSTSAQAR